LFYQQKKSRAEQHQLIHSSAMKVQEKGQVWDSSWTCHWGLHLDIRQEKHLVVVITSKVLSWCEGDGTFTKEAIQECFSLLQLLSEWKEISRECYPVNHAGTPRSIP
jgi:hypothetical protein